jgi:FKBP-type peptidyl-prolyl cis-trans isomerase
MNNSIKLVIFLAVGALIVWAGVSYNKKLDEEAVSFAEQARIAGEEQLKKDMALLTIEDIIPGTGAEAKMGDLVSVHYTGSFLDGTVFDSSKTKGTPSEFKVGDERIIKGWNLGLLGMKVGGTRHITIPPELAYGAEGSPAIPPNSTLKFEVELLEIK